nr:odorant binding protein 1 [Aromia bungii]
MRGVILLVVSCVIVTSKALECGIGKVNGEKVKETLSFCVKNNDTLEKIWEMATASSTSSMESRSDSSEETNPLNKSARKTRATGRVQGTMIQVNERRSSEDDANMANTTETSDERSDTTTSSTMDTAENCIVRCVFEHMGMTNDNGLPDHAKVVEGLLKTATNRELRVFLQESADECFQQMDQENNADTCAYSSKIVTCLANKGRVNCADWPAGNLPF